jgi:cholesterol transport system auxiliary component
MRRRIVVCGLLIAGLAAACSFAPRDVGRGFMFALPPVKVSYAPTGDSLIVALPTTSAELDTYRIALTRDNGRWDYYAAAKWVDFLPALVQDSLTKAIAEAGLFKSVTMDQSGLAGNLILKTEISAFQAEYEQGSKLPVIRIRLTESILGHAQRKLMTTFDVRAEKRAAGNHLPDIQAAFASAFGDAQRKLLQNLQQKTR